MAAAPGPDGRHDDLESDELEGLALLVPDDPRSLDADRLAYYKELRAKARGRPVGPARARRWMSSGFTGPVVLVVLVVAGLFGSTLGMFGGALPVARPPQPLATAPAAAPGHVGGLLPDAVVTVESIRASLRGARPAVIALVPSQCPGCSGVLRSLLGQAREYGLQLLLLGPQRQAPQLDELDRDALAGAATVALDVDDVVRPAYHPSGVTALLVSGDGVVADVVPDLTAGTRLEPELAQVARTGPAQGAA